MSEPEQVVGVIWCPDSRYNQGIGWRFPHQVDEKLRQLCAGASALHLFGGRASWGIRLDIDPVVRPDVIGDAWMAPFHRDSFDVVILDPPYVHLRGVEKVALFQIACWIARHRVYWFHTHWASAAGGLTYERGWLVRTGRSAACRCLLEFSVSESKRAPGRFFTRGPGRIYNRWLGSQMPLGLPGLGSLRLAGDRAH